MIETSDFEAIALLAVDDLLRFLTVGADNLESTWELISRSELSAVIRMGLLEMSTDAFWNDVGDWSSSMDVFCNMLMIGPPLIHHCCSQ